MSALTPINNDFFLPETTACLLAWMYYLLRSSCRACSQCVNNSVCPRRKSKKGLVYSEWPLWSGHNHGPLQIISSDIIHKCLGLQDSLERRSKRVDRVLSGRGEETEKGEPASWELRGWGALLGSNGAGLKTCGHDLWLVLRYTLCRISGSRDKGMSFECQSCPCRWQRPAMSRRLFKFYLEQMPYLTMVSVWTVYLLYWLGQAHFLQASTLPHLYFISHHFLGSFPDFCVLA